jgi:uncharacterized protein (DUF2235 family)
MKRLALFLDGTWNDPDDHTNVRDLFDAVRQETIDGVQQLAYYRKGVGTEWYNRLVGGTVGAGLSDNVRHAYEWLVRNYEDGDEIFIFGFSRGAYTARSIAGVIINCGLLRQGADMSVTDIYGRYAQGKKSTPLYNLLRLPDAERNALGEPEKRLLRASRRVEIKMIGVWDTVGALGVPWTEAPLIGRRNFFFHNTNLSMLIEHAYHALAIDEHRGPYKPTLWTKFIPAVPDPPRTTQIREPIVEQRWFIGAHSNVGGGYAKDTLRRIPLAWLQRKASECGLKFSQPLALSGEEFRTVPVDSYGNFLHGAYRVLRLGKRFHRPIGAGRRAVQRGFSEPIKETIDASVFQRVGAFPDYRPENLKKWAEQKGKSLDAPDQFALNDGAHPVT